MSKVRKKSKNNYENSVDDQDFFYYNDDSEIKELFDTKDLNHNRQSNHLSDEYEYNF